jgi:hypothetical protein
VIVFWSEFFFVISVFFFLFFFPDFELFIFYFLSQLQTVLLFIFLIFLIVFFFIERYWTYDAMAAIDLPTMVNFILQKTGTITPPSMPLLCSNF